MRNFESWMNSKRGKVITWVCLVVFAILLIGGAFAIRNKLNKDREITPVTNVEEQTTNEEKIIEYRRLSGNSYTINQEAHTISFAPEVGVKKFCE